MPLASFLLASLAFQTPFPAYKVSPDLHEVANLKTFLKDAPLADEHRALLSKNLFVVAAADMPEIQYIYAQNDYANIPSIVTTDSMLHIFHVMFDSTLRNVEQKSLSPRAIALTKKMIAQSVRMRATATSAAGKLAALRTVAYFGVADRLLGQTTPLPKDALTLVNRELQLIKDGRGFEMSAVVPNKIDFTQFIVRGHYTKTPTLQRYFRGMMWYGLAPLEITDKSGKPHQESARIAVNIADALGAANLTKEWQAIYEPTTLYAGTVNSITPGMIAQVRASMPGSPDTLNWDAFSKAVAKMDPSMYRAKMVYQTGVAEGVQMRFMGQRGLLDSWVFSRVTDQERPLPTGLDVMAAFGSKTAEALIAQNPDQFNSRGWNEYDHRRAEVREKLAAIPASEWAKNLYNGWLDVLRAKVTAPPHAVPAFMQTDAWGRMNLVSGLASWAELRHDTLLYGEQTAVEMGDGEEEQPYVRHFVEPNIPVWSKLLNMVKMLRTGLNERGMLDKDTKEDLDGFKGTLTFLHSCAQKEVAGKPLAKAEHTRIRKIDGELEDVIRRLLLRGLSYNTLTEDDTDMALVADVHSADPLAFTVATGHADDLIAVVPIEGKLYLARGPVFSYYEFTVPMTDRLTDQKWKAMLREKKAPARPKWTDSFFSNKPARESSE